VDLETLCTTPTKREDAAEVVRPVISRGFFLLHGAVTDMSEIQQV